MPTQTKYSISALPLSSASRLLNQNLTPDTHTPSVSDFRAHVLTKTPSLQRRARLLSPQSHFSYVTPMPLPFPYDIEPPTSPEPNEDKGSYIEKWLAAREAIHDNPRRSLSMRNASPLRKYYSKNRDTTRELIGISETGLQDCLPHLDVGDAFAILGEPTLSGSTNGGGMGKPSDFEEVVAARNDLIDILGGHATLMTPPDTPADQSFAPWSLRYSGHQFGSWAGQLGDGRAITILVTPYPSSPEISYEIQLKGAGRTPFSRSADGLAVLRSSIREYLCSEAMQALGIPTSRSLTLISLPELPVARERLETSCILTRLAPSFLRIGSFEAFNGPTGMFFFGGGQQKPDWEGLRILGEWVTQQVLKLDVEEGKAWGSKLIFDVAKRNAKMVAGWQAYGFMHGVINTDNVSLLGLTIDYGPYAFMDVFDSFHICNHTDETGRYAYRYQPSMIIYSLRALLNALAPLIGAEAELGGKAVPAGWAAEASQEKIDEWRRKGLDLKSEMERVAQQEIADEYGSLMRKRLGLRGADPTDETHLFKPLLDIMETHKLDFHGTFRTLSTFRPSLLSSISEPGAPVPQPNDATGEPLNASGAEKEKASAAQDAPPTLETFVAQLLSWTPNNSALNYDQATQDWLNWLDKYALRIKSERVLWDPVDVDKEREIAAKKANPRFVLRQWLLEEVIKRVEADTESGKRVLAKVMHMASNPFEPWGAEAEKTLQDDLSAEEREEKRYCGMGESKMLGFQCSCSS